MKTVNSYFVKSASGTSAWLAVGKPVPMNATIIGIRPMLMPDPGKVLRHKETGEISTGHWLRDDSTDNWEEIEEQGAE